MESVKKYIVIILYRVIALLIKLLPVSNGSNHLLLIKTDEIGDYILFRNLFVYFKQSEKYKGYKITMLGSGSWRKLYEEYDNDIFDEVIWLDKKKFGKNLSYVFEMYSKIRAIGSTDVINCVFSRNSELDDAFAFVAKGGYKAAMKCNNTNRLFKYDTQNAFIYTNIIAAGDQKIFDFIRNRNFVSTILDSPEIPISMRLDVKPYDQMPDKDYYVLFLGAGNPERKWPVNNFIEAANHIESESTLIPVICGGPGDENDAAEFMAGYKKEAIDYAGKTSLTMMIELIKNAKFLICVDTGALHMAAAVGCPVVGLYSGKFFGRFAPYPKEISQEFYPVYPDFVDELIKKNDPVLYDTFTMKNSTIKMIRPEKIYPFLDSIIQKYIVVKSNQ